MSLLWTRGVDLLSRGGAPHCRAGDAPELRGKGDSSRCSVCNLLASTRAATVSSSARKGGLELDRGMPAAQRKQEPSDCTGCRACSESAALQVRGARTVVRE